MAEHIIGFDIGGTKSAAVLGRTSQDRPEILDRVAFPTETERTPEHTLSRLERAARELVKRQGISLKQVKAIGISCGGPLDTHRGLILSPPNLPGWDDIPVVSRYEESLGIPARLQNDANACALAEWRWGAGRGCQHMVFLTFGTGMGAGLILNGRLYTGANDLAGEVGHVRLEREGPLGHGKRGSFEGFCSGGGIAQLARQAALEQWKSGKTVSFLGSKEELQTLDARVLGETASSGDAVAVAVFDLVARYLGQGLAILIDILNPETIVIGGIFPRQHHLLWPGAQEVILREALPLTAAACRIVSAELGEAIGDYASLAVAIGE